MKAKTFDEWKEIGYRVKKGERSTTRDSRTGKALFTRNQVEEYLMFNKRDDKIREE